MNHYQQLALCQALFIENTQETQERQYGAG